MQFVIFLWLGKVFWFLNVFLTSVNHYYCLEALGFHCTFTAGLLNILYFCNGCCSIYNQLITVDCHNRPPHIQRLRTLLSFLLFCSLVIIVIVLTYTMPKTLTIFLSYILKKCVKLENTIF